METHLSRDNSAIFFPVIDKGTVKSQVRYSYIKSAINSTVEIRVAFEPLWPTVMNSFKLNLMTKKSHNVI